MNKIFLVIGALSVVFSMQSCSKERIEGEDDSLNEYVSANEYFDSKKQKEQEFIIDTAGSGPIIGNQQTKLWISKEVLMFPNGDSVHWPYTVKLIELYTPKDMLYYQLPNVSDDKLLTTAGEVRVRAFKDGQELVLRPSCTWTVEMPNIAPATDMSIYYEDSEPVVVNWNSSPVGVFDSTAYGYSGNIKKLGWVQCAKPATYNTDNLIFTYTSTTDKLDNVPIFIYYPTLQSLIQVFNNKSISLPKQEQAKTILIGITGGGDLFYDYRDTTVSQSIVIDVKMKETTDAALTQLLDSF